MSPTARAALLGGGLALVLVAAFTALVVTGVVTLPEPQAAVPDRLLVIATAPEEDALAAPFAFVYERGGTSAELLDTSERVVVSGTSAQSAREAYPFVGGAGVARALAPQTGGETLPWVVLPPRTWAELVDEVGGIEVDLPTTVSVYRDGDLVVLEAGRSTLSGEEAVALASATSFIEGDRHREQVVSQLSAGLSAAVSSNLDRLGGFVADEAADSSLEAATIGAFSAD